MFFYAEQNISTFQYHCAVGILAIYAYNTIIRQKSCSFLNVQTTSITASPYPL